MDGAAAFLIELMVLLAALALAGVAWSTSRRAAAAQRASVPHAVATEAEQLAILRAVLTGRMVVITDDVGVTRWVSPSFQVHTGYSLDDMVDRTPGSVLQGPDTDRATVAELRRHLRAGLAHTCTILNYAADGRELWMELEIHPVVDDGRVTGYVGIQHDVTDRVVSTAELVRARDVTHSLAQEKSHALTMVADSLAAPIDQITSALRALVTEDLTPAQFSLADTARLNAVLLRNAVENVTSVSSVDAADLEPMHVHYRIYDVMATALATVEPRARVKGLVLEMACDDRIPDVVVGDASRVRQVLVNLLANAVTFTEHGRVVLSASRETAAGGRHPSMTARPASSVPGVLVLRISDTGVGIPADRMQMIFTPFQQGLSSSGGPGVGLAASRYIVELLGGTIDLSSAPGAGTTVEVRLPLVRGDVSRLGEPAITALGTRGAPETIATSTTPATSPIDVDALRTGDCLDEEMTVRITAFVESSFSIVDGLLRALAENDAWSMRLLAHQMKENATAMAAPTVAAAAAELQWSAQPGNLHSTAPLIESVGRELRRIRAWVRASELVPD